MQLTLGQILSQEKERAELLVGQGEAPVPTPV